jgi:hypothetical protein
MAGYMTYKRKRNYQGGSSYKRRAVGFRKRRKWAPRVTRKRYYRRRTFSKKKRVRFALKRREKKVVKYVHYDRFDRALSSVSQGAGTFQGSVRVNLSTIDKTEVGYTDLKAYARLYDRFRIKKQTLTFWIRNDINDDGQADYMTELYSYYDSDGSKRTIMNAPDKYMRTPTGTHQFLKVGQKYKKTLYPKWAEAGPNGPNQDLTKMYQTCDNKKNYWFDGACFQDGTTHDHTQIPPSLNDISLLFIGKPGLAITMENRIHFEFTRLTNGADIA